MIFITLLAFSAFSIAAVAGYFSIYGLASIFSGWFFGIIAMGIALEMGKLVAASYLYRYWNDITRSARMYLFSAIFVLMLITSAGIFGFLSQGYQQDTLSLKQQEQRISLLQHEQEELIDFKNENIARKKQIDDDIASLPNNYITARQRLLKSFGPELEIIKEDIAKYTTKINDKTLKISEIKQEKLINEVHIGPIIFIAKAFDTDTDEAVKWLIFMLIFAFDPLAVMLTLATNKVLIIRQQELGIETKRVAIDIPPTPIVVEKVTEKSEPKTEALDIVADNSELSIEDLEEALDGLSDRRLTTNEKLRKQIFLEMLSRKKAALNTE